jgi:hypothetical protein
MLSSIFRLATTASAIILALLSDDGMQKGVRRYLASAEPCLDLHLTGVELRSMLWQGIAILRRPCNNLSTRPTPSKIPELVLNSVFKKDISWWRDWILGPINDRIHNSS